MEMGKRKSNEVSPLIGFLQEKLKGCGISMTELSKRTGVSQPQLSRFIKGERSLTLPAAEKLVEYFGIKLVDPEAPTQY
jgi:plasmid maintenance system antidote protein VapI